MFFDGFDGGEQLHAVEPGDRHASLGAGSPEGPGARVADDLDDPSRLAMVRCQDIFETADCFLVFPGGGEHRRPLLSLWVDEIWPRFEAVALKATAFSSTRSVRSSACPT